MTVDERAGIDRTRSHNDALDRVGQLGLWPHDLVDAKVLTQTVAAPFNLHEVFAGHETGGPFAAKLVGQDTGDDVYFVESGEGDQQIAPLHTSLFEHTGAGAAAVQELDVKGTEPIGHPWVVVDQGQLVIGRQRLRQRIADLAAPDDDDPHARLLVVSAGRTGVDSGTHYTPCRQTVLLQFAVGRG